MDWINAVTLIAGSVWLIFVAIKVVNWIILRPSMETEFHRMYGEWLQQHCFLDSQGNLQQNVDLLIAAWEEAGRPFVIVPFQEPVQVEQHV